MKNLTAKAHKGRKTTKEHEGRRKKEGKNTPSSLCNLGFLPASSSSLLSTPAPPLHLKPDIS
jgi:hypothetical protein